MEGLVASFSKLRTALLEIRYPTPYRPPAPPRRPQKVGPYPSPEEVATNAAATIRLIRMAHKSEIWRRYLSVCFSEVPRCSVVPRRSSRNPRFGSDRRTRSTRPGGRAGGQKLATVFCYKPVQDYRLRRAPKTIFSSEV